jgi:phosphohistidine phosphatase
MRLVLVRHAQAVPGPDDDARPLSPAGDAQAHAAARALGRLDLGLAVVVASPARRCRDTALVIAAAVGVDGVEVAPELALGAPPQAALDRLLREPLPTLAVGHAPDLGTWAAELLGGDAMLSFDCGAAAAFEVDATGHRAVLVWSLPGALLAALGNGGLR